MQMWRNGRVTRYEENTYEEFQVCGQYGNDGIEMHSKGSLAQKGKHENIATSRCGKAHFKEDEKPLGHKIKERCSVTGCGVSEDGPAERASE